MTSKEEASSSTGVLDKLKPPNDDYHSENLLELVFVMSRFRECLDLPSFTHIELEEELIKESDNYKADYRNVYRSLLLSQLLDSLLTEFSRNSTIKDPDMLLVMFAEKNFRTKIFGEMKSCDFHLLPTQIKIYVLLQVAQFYCEQEQAQNVDQFRSANELRVMNFGFCSEGYEVFYFQDLRLFKKHPASETTFQRDSIDKKILEAPWKDLYEEIAVGDHYECIAWNEDTWLAIIKNLKKTRRVLDKKLATKLKTLLDKIKKQFDELLANYNTQKASRNRQAQKIDYEQRRSLGLLRSSSRLQGKTKEVKDNNQNKVNEENVVLPDQLLDSKALQAKNREERHNRRLGIKTGSQSKATDTSETNGLNSLTVNVVESITNEKEEKNFESPSSSPSHSLKEMVVSNFRIDKPPISPDQDQHTSNPIVTIDDSDVDDDSIILDKITNGTAVKNDNKHKNTRKRRSGPEKEKEENGAPAGGQAIPLPNPKMMGRPKTFKLAPEGSSAMEYHKPKLRTEPPEKKARVTDGDVDASARTSECSENPEIDEEMEDEEMRSSDEEDEEVENNEVGVEDLEGGEVVAEENVEHVGEEVVVEAEDDEEVATEEVEEIVDPSFIPMTVPMLVAIRIVRWRFDDVFKDWYEFHKTQESIPGEYANFVETFPALKDERYLRMERWGVLKMMMFRMPLRLGGVADGKPRALSTPVRKLALSFMVFMRDAWPLLFEGFGGIDKMLLTQTHAGIATLQRLVANDVKTAPSSQS